MSDFFVWLIFFYRNKKSLRCKDNAPYNGGKDNSFFVNLPPLCCEIFRILG